MRGNRDSLKQLEHLFKALSRSKHVVGSIKHYSKETEKLYSVTVENIKSKYAGNEFVIALPPKLPNVSKYFDVVAPVLYVVSPFVFALVAFWLDVDPEYAIITGLYYPAFVLLYHRYRGKMLYKQTRLMGNLYKLMEYLRKQR